VIGESGHAPNSPAAAGVRGMGGVGHSPGTVRVAAASVKGISPGGGVVYRLAGQPPVVTTDL
jgi:hypothetical protein